MNGKLDKNGWQTIQTRHIFRSYHKEFVTVLLALSLGNNTEFQTPVCFLLKMFSYYFNVRHFVEASNRSISVSFKVCNMKKTLRGAHCKHCALTCSKAEPKIFAPTQTPFPGARDGQNLISWRWSLPSPTNPVWWGSMHAISSYRGNTHRPPVRHRQGRLQYTAPQLSAQCRN